MYIGQVHSADSDEAAVRRADPRGHCLGHRVRDTYAAILAACCDAGCDAWNAPMATADVIASIGTRACAQARI
ncbi:MAG: hypothetical protein WBG11_15630 [Methylocella sp.]